MEFTLVSTIYNENDRLEDTIHDLKLQTLQPGEIIITDAGSTDGTYEKLIAWKRNSAIPIKVLQKQKCNVAEGRNMAIRAAKFDLIASTDFGCRFHPQWLESLMLPFRDKSIKAVAGLSSITEADIQTMAAKAAYIIFNGYQQVVNENYIPSSRSVAYYKDVFETVGGYYEWLTLAADDTVFGKVAKKKGYVFHVVQTPYVFWGRHTKVKAYAKEAYRYGLGDGEARINVRSSVSSAFEITLRYFSFLAVPIVSYLIVSSRISLNYVLVLLPFAFGLRSYYHYTKRWMLLRSDKYNFKVYLYGFYLLEGIRRSYMKGYYKGYFFSPESMKREARKLQKILKQQKQ